MILFYVKYRVLLSLTKSILEKKRKRAVFHKLIIPFLLNEGSWEQKETDFERGKERKKNHHQKKEDFLSCLFSCVLFFKCFPLFLLTRQSVISRDKESSFSFPSNKLECFLFTSQSSASRCVCTHRAERAIFRDTNTPELAHAHTHTHTHKKKGTNTFLSLYPSLSLFFSPFGASLLLECNDTAMMI